MSPEPTPRSRTLRILLADDSSIARELLRESIKDALAAEGRADYALVEVGSGEQALARMEQERFDLLVLDFLLPGLNGEAVIQKVRAAPEGARLPIIVISCGPEEVERKALAAGASCFLAKPVVTSRLTRALRDALAAADPG